MSKDREEQVSRNEEIRAIFIFGLLAVFAFVRIQYQNLTLTYPNGTFNLAPLIDDLIILWSVYALFMVLGLSDDALGKKTAKMFRSLSIAFLQYSYLIMVIFLFPFGVVVYGVRVFFILAIILVVACAGLLIRLQRKPKNIRKRFSILEYIRTGRAKNDLPKILSIVFMMLATAILYYPDSWFGSTVIVWASFFASTTIACLILVLQKPEDEESYQIDGDYYF